MHTETHRAGRALLTENLADEGEAIGALSQSIVFFGHGHTAEALGLQGIQCVLRPDTLLINFGGAGCSDLSGDLVCSILTHPCLIVIHSFHQEQPRLCRTAQCCLPDQSGCGRFGPFRMEIDGSWQNFCGTVAANIRTA